MSSPIPTGDDGENLPVEPISIKRRRSAEQVIPVLEETAVIKKDVVATGRVRVATRTRTVKEFAKATLHGQEVEIERVAIGRPVSGDPPKVRTEGDVTIVPVFEETLVVEKRLMLKEELHIRLRKTVDEVELPVDLRRQEVDIQRSKEPQRETHGEGRRKPARKASRGTDS